MKNVYYDGPSDVRIISSATLLANGFVSATLTWDKANGWVNSVADALGDWLVAQMPNEFTFTPTAPANWDWVHSFVTKPAGWGQTWRKGLAESNSRIAKLGIVGDSVGTGIYARTAVGPRWVGGYPHIVRDVLQAKYGNGGIGWVDFRTNTGIFGGVELGAETGAWTVTAGGPNDGARRPTVAGNGASITLPFDGTVLDIITQTAAGYGSITYQIDGGAIVPIDQNVANSIQTTTVVGLSNAAHSVKLTATTGNSKVVAIRGRNTTGVLVDNMSSSGRAYSTTTSGGHFGAATDGWAGETTASTSFTAMGKADAVVICLGLNDLTATGDIWANSTGWNTLSHIYAHTEKLALNVGYRPDVVIVIPHFGRGEELDTPENAQLSTQLHIFAESIGAAVVDVWDMARHSWDYWDSLGAWPDPFGGGKDNVHPNIIGHEIMAQGILAVLDN